MNWLSENLVIFANARFVSSLGLSLDIIGALLVAIEVVRVFRGPLTLDEETARKKQGGEGSTSKFGVPYKHVVNPDYEKFEKSKRTYMRCGLFCLVGGFLMQGFPLWFIE